MNIPEIYLVEPYNAYAPKGKKKHWMQEVEEQALLAKIIAEQQALKEAAARTGNTPNVLPPQAPPTSQAGSQGYSGGAGAAGGANTTGGGGGAPRPQFWNPLSGSNLWTVTVTPTTSSAPTTVQFTVAGNDTLALGGAQVSWNFGDGTTGGAPATFHTYATGSFVPSYTITSTLDGTVLATGSLAVTMSVPTVTAAFTVTGTTVQLTNGFYTASAGDLLTFVNGSSTNNPANTLTYVWTFGSASATSTATNPTLAYTITGSYLVTLTTSGSYGTSAVGQRRLLITGSNQ